MPRVRGIQAVSHWLETTSEEAEHYLEEREDFSKFYTRSFLALPLLIAIVSNVIMRTIDHFWEFESLPEVLYMIILVLAYSMWFYPLYLPFALLLIWLTKRHPQIVDSVCLITPLLFASVLSFYSMSLATCVIGVGYLNVVLFYWLRRKRLNRISFPNGTISDFKKMQENRRAKGV